MTIQQLMLRFRPRTDLNSDHWPSSENMTNTTLLSVGVSAEAHNLIPTITMTVALLLAYDVIVRFWKFFHWHTQQ